MNRAQRMLAVISDGNWHSREEIQQRSPGRFYLTNNAASDLRKLGYEIDYQIRDGLRCYRMVARPLEATAAAHCGDVDAVASSGSWEPSPDIAPVRPESPDASAGVPIGPSLAPLQLVIDVPVTTREREAAA